MKNKTPKVRYAISALTVLMTLALSACGGNGSGANQPEQPQPAPPSGQVPPQAPSQIAPPAAKGQFIGFESAPVRPIAETPDGRQVLITNTANNSLDIF